LKSSCRSVIASEFVPRLEARIRSTLGSHGWTLEIDPNAPDGDTVDFKYPEGIPGALASGYIRRAVRLELGCRGRPDPMRGSNPDALRGGSFP